jgi:hypothetical protein
VDVARRKIRATMDPFEVPIFDTYGLASSDQTELGTHRISNSDDLDYDLPFRTTGILERGHDWTAWVLP